MPIEPWWLPAVLATEACLGYPPVLYRRVTHPVVWIGRLIDALEQRWNNLSRSESMRRFMGMTTVVAAAGSAALVGAVVQALAGQLRFGGLLIVLIASTGLAQRSLYLHVRDVLQPLLREDLAGARTAVARIIGRDTAELAHGAVAAAAIESLAESFNDGVVAPAFWFLLGGLPGLFAYKALNTADSLIGHREPRWRAFGWAAARADDIANLLPARIAGTLLALAGGRGMRIMWRDARKHASPNAGWPEAALAGALQVRLGGPARYDGKIHERPNFGDGRTPRAADLAHGLRIYVRGCVLLWLLAAIVAAAASLPLDAPRLPPA